MRVRINRARLKRFIARRRINSYGLMVLTAFGAVVTLICALTGFKRTDTLALITFCMVVLCAVQRMRMMRAFRTLRSFRGSRKKTFKREISAE